MPSSLATAIGLREVSPRKRHTPVLDSFDELRMGETLELVDDHDPVPLRHLLQDRSAGACGG